MKIICIGNRFSYPDNFGILIYEKLIKIDLDYEIIEGGIGGMNLLPHFETNDKILIIIDYAQNFDKNILTKKDIEQIELTEYNHSTAFLYLLKSIENDYTIFVENSKFDEKKIDKYIPQILKLASEL